MTSPIKIYGIGCNWTERYAVLYKEKLCEVGFEVKLLKVNGESYVAYSYRTFTNEELDLLLKGIFGENDET